LEILNFYGDPALNATVLTERALLTELHGGCNYLPIRQWQLGVYLAVELVAVLRVQGGANLAGLGARQQQRR
jgi:hypothetical protein